MIGLIMFIIVAVLIATFTGFNLGNRCDISLIFYTFKDVPVFLTIIISFVAGIVVCLPFAFGKGRHIAAKKIDKIKARAEKAAQKKSREGEKSAQNNADASVADDTSAVEIANAAGETSNGGASKIEKK